MVTKKKKKPILEAGSWPKVTKGSHLTVIEHEDGQVEMEWDFTALEKDVHQAINKFEKAKK